MEDERSFGPCYGKPELAGYAGIMAIAADLLAACKAARESFERLNMKGTPLDRQLQAAIEKAEPTT